MPSLQLPDSLVEVDWLYSQLGNPNLVILDGSWHIMDLIENGSMRPNVQLEKLLGGHFHKTGQTICSCGSGVTACVLALAAHRIGYDNVSVYDGSWSEWGLPTDLPVVISDD